MPLNAACRPNEAQIVPRRTNSQPSASATGIRAAKPTSASPNASPAVAPPIVRTWAKAKNSAPTMRPRRGPDAAHPGRRGEAAEQDLLAERRHERAGHERQDEADRRRRSVAAGWPA